jgi:hypothetical protein
MGIGSSHGTLTKSRMGSLIGTVFNGKATRFVLFRRCAETGLRYSNRVVQDAFKFGTDKDIVSHRKKWFSMASNAAT